MNKKLLKQIISEMSVREKIGQLMMLDFRYWGKNNKGKYIPFTAINSDIKNIISKYRLGGIVLFRENIKTFAQIIKLTEELQKAAKIPLIIGTDQEGGIVTRLQTGTDMPGNMCLGASDNCKLMKKVSEVIGKELHSLGINLNFAPVLDVNSNQINPIIGIRSFGSDPALVSRMGKAYIEGLRKIPVMSCAKHFPGHGNTQTDTHFGLAAATHKFNSLMNIDIQPFKDNLNADTIMAAHVIVPALDNAKILSKKSGKKIGIPSTLSKKIITEFLRNKLKFDGVILTDAMDMKAISDNFENKEAIIMSITAGVDFAVMPVRIWNHADISKLEKLFIELEQEYSQNHIFAKCVDASIHRILILKAKYNLLKKRRENHSALQKKIKKASLIVGCKSHRDLEKKASASGITCLKNDNNTLPFALNNNSKVLIFDSNRARIGLLKGTLSEIKKETKINFTVKSLIYKPDSELTSRQKKAAAQSNYILVITYNLNKSDTLPNKLAKLAKKEKKKCVFIASRNPYDIAYLSDCSAYLAIYGTSGFDQTNSSHGTLSANIKTVPYAIFITEKNKINRIKTKGKLPVSIMDKDSKKVLYKFGSGIIY